MTLIELVVYVSISAVLAVLAGALFTLFRRSNESTTVNYFLSADTETAVSELRRDLQQCALTTIQTYPANNASQPPGASWASVLNAADANQIDANDTGNPNWRDHVYYTLQPNGKEKTGRLVRWSKAVADDALTTPTLAPLLPSPVGSNQSKTVHTRVLLPNQQLFGVGADGQLDKHGGFRLQFVRRQGEDGAETLSDDNPATVSLQKNSTAFEGNTRLVQVELKFATDSSTGKGNFYAVRFRVCPRY